jgi:UDPglucose 6-dehydrogenase
MPMPANDLAVCVAGIWHLGLVNSVCLAETGLQVTGVDADVERVERLNRGLAPIAEPEIDGVLSSGLRSGRLRYTTDLAAAAGGATHILVAFDTPVDANDDVDLAPIFSAVDSMIPALRDGATIIICSQVPVGTCDLLEERIHSVRPDLHFGLACVPENLRLGQAVERFRHPDFIVIGAETSDTIAEVERLYKPIEAPRVHLNLRTAEMTKHAMNAYLATMISFGNELGNLCDLVGADATSVIEVLKLEARVSPKAPLNPGYGFSGGTLARDMKVLEGIGRSHSYEAPLINGILRLNHLQNTVALRAIERRFGSFANLTVGLLGLTYKPGTSTIRRSAAIEMLLNLRSGGARVKAYDPMADSMELSAYEGLYERCGSPYETAEGASVIVIATPWPECTRLDWDRLRGLMQFPLLVDAGNALEAQSLRDHGFTYFGVGRGAHGRR